MRTAAASGKLAAMYRTLPLVALLIIACDGTQTINVGGGEEDSNAPAVQGDTGTDALPGDTSEDTDTGEEVEDTAANAAWQDEFFVDTMIHDIDITLSDDAYHDIRRDGHTYVMGDVTVDGETITGIGLRLRGKIGSYREISGKPKFKIDMSQFVAGQKFHGLHSMALNNEVVDCSYLREPLAYKVFREAGIAASRTSFARVRVNDEVYGLYVIIEVPDSQLLEDRFPGDDEGNLYDGKYIYNWDFGSYTLLDFDSGVDDMFGLEEGTDVGHADIAAISDAIDGAPRGGGFVEVMDPLVDWNQWHTSWAVEQWVGHLDGYQMNKNNYRVYFRPSDGKMIYLPTDFDYGFLSDGGWGVGWTGPLGTLASRCFLDASCREAQVAAVDTMLAGVDPDALRTYFDAMAELTHDDASDDPRRECSTSSVWSTQDYMRSWISGRDAQVRATWGL